MKKLRLPRSQYSCTIWTSNPATDGPEEEGKEGAEDSVRERSVDEVSREAVGEGSEGVSVAASSCTMGFRL